MTNNNAGTKTKTQKEAMHGTTELRVSAVNGSGGILLPLEWRWACYEIRRTVGQTLGWIATCSLAPPVRYAHMEQPVPRSRVLFCYHRNFFVPTETTTKHNNYNDRTQYTHIAGHQS